MRRILACVLVGIFLVALDPVPWVSAQPNEHAEQQKAEEFVRLWRRLELIKNPEEQIALINQALELERDLRQWPLPHLREEMRAILWFDLGNGYLRWSRGDRAENVERAIAAFEQALQFFTRERSPNAWGSLQHSLAIAHRNRIRGEHADNLEKAIASYEAALTIFTRDSLPREWATTQNDLGIAYWARIRGDRADNMEKAIAAYEAALTVFTRESLPREWAETQSNLASAYGERIRGEHADNLEKAIAAYESALTVRTREDLPRAWAQTQNNLAMTYLDRIRGERADNLEKAIAGFEAALTVRNSDDLPREWAATQNNLGNAYLARVRGERAGNLEKAIAAFEAALTVRTREALPREWAQMQNNLAIAYETRIRGERADNLEKAIAAYEAALTVFTREALPRDWATTQNNLGIAYSDRIRGDRADNLEKAIAAHEAALTVTTHDALPRAWATTQNNIGSAYSDRIRGDRADNLEKAIAAYEAALTVTTREALPREWAQTQYGLGNAYLARIRGARDDNQEKAIAAYEAALTIYTRENLPRDRLHTGRALGGALLEAGDWRKAGLAYANAREAFLLLFGQGLNDAEARDLIATAGPLFAEAAFAAAQRGESETALSLASEGRAQRMAVALRLQSLKLSAQQLQTLGELRAAIRTAERSVETTEGAERAAGLGKLASLRLELLGLVKGGAAAESNPGSALAQAHALIAGGGAVVVPILTRVGGKIVIVGGVRPLARTPQRATDVKARGLTPSTPLITVLDLPELTTGRLDAVLGSWFAAYPASNLSHQEINKRLAQWEKALDALIPELWPLFVGKLDAALKELGLKPGARLVWLPTGALGVLPLGAAQDPVSKQRLADHYEIVYAPSLAALTAAQARVTQVTPPTLAVVINPTGDLPGTEREGGIVASHFKAGARTLLERKKATPEAVLAALKGKSHWHFASHGTFSWDDARQSALIMHGHARLSVGRLLESEGLGRPRLVVLSACETAICDICEAPDEFIGLPGTFTALGAAGVLGTLWPVSDTATALLMAKFYELHMGQGLAPSTALSRAQTWLRQATNRDLQNYARLAARQNRLKTRHMIEIEQELSEEGLTRSRNSALVEWIAPDVARSADKRPSNGAGRLGRPYVHPYYWAGFIHTGL